MSTSPARAQDNLSTQLFTPLAEFATAENRTGTVGSSSPIFKVSIIRDVLIVGQAVTGSTLKREV